jgi:hypothetical protein
MQRTNQLHCYNPQLPDPSTSFPGNRLKKIFQQRELFFRSTITHFYTTYCPEKINYFSSLQPIVQRGENQTDPLKANP